MKITFGEAAIFAELKKDLLIFKPTNKQARANSYDIKIKLTDNNPYFKKSSQDYTISALVYEKQSNISSNST